MGSCIAPTGVTNSKAGDGRDSPKDSTVKPPLVSNSRPDSKSQLLMRIQRLEDKTALRNEERVQSLEDKTQLLSNEIERLRDEVQTIKLSDVSKSPPTRRNSFSLRRVQSTTLSDTYEFDCPIRQRKSITSRTSRTENAPRSPGTDSLVSTRSTTSNRPKRRHIIHQMNEIEAYGKGLNPHDPDVMRTYSSNPQPAGPLSVPPFKDNLSCIDSVSDALSDYDCDPQME